MLPPITHTFKLFSEAYSMFLEEFDCEFAGCQLESNQLWQVVKKRHQVRCGAITERVVT
jgi:hypothetical protein